MKFYHEYREILSINKKAPQKRCFLKFAINKV